MPTLNLTALSSEEKEELRIRLEQRQRYEASSSEERARITYRAKLESDFASFVKEAWPILEPGNTLSWSWHYDLIAEYLTLAQQKKIKRLLINVPPRTLKSILITVMFPVWVWTKTPGQSFACASYSAGLSTEHSVKRRNLIESEWFQRHWGDRIWLKKDQNEKTKYQNNYQAQMISTSVGGTATGLGGNFLIVDDGVKPDEIASEAAIGTLHKWFDNTWRTRLNDPANDVMIVVEQRTGELDLTGKCLSADAETIKAGEKPEWTHICLPLEADAGVVDKKTLTQRLTFPLSKRVHERALGDILQPDRFPPTVVRALKVLRILWATQYQQRPSPLEGNLIKRSEVRYYGGIDPETGIHDPELPSSFDVKLVSVDCAFKDLKTSDYVAIVGIGAKGPDRFILDVINAHLDEPATEQAAIRMKYSVGAHTVLIEDKANGPAVIKKAKKKISGVVAIEPMGGKMSRMYAMCGEWQSGNWWLPRNATWTEMVIEQLTKFPAAANDDLADAVSQSAIWLQSKGFSYGLTEYLKTQDREMTQKKEKRYKNKQPANLAEAIESTDHISPVPDEPMQKVTTSSVIKPAIADNTLRCPQCSSAAIGRIGSMRRCNGCGAQFGVDANGKPCNVKQDNTPAQGIVRNGTLRK